MEWILEMMAMRSEFLLNLDAIVKAPALGIENKALHLDINGGLGFDPKIPTRRISMLQEEIFSTGQSGRLTVTA